jgi:hypothetical protein
MPKPFNQAAEQMMRSDWRALEILKLMRQCVVCPVCGALVATEAGIDAHKNWHGTMTQHVEDVDTKLDLFSKEIVDPETGLQKQIQKRLDTITNYVTDPQTGLEKRVTDAITDLRSDATGAISSLDARIAALEALGLTP